MLRVESSSLSGDLYFLQFYYIFMFEASYLMKLLLLHVLFLLIFYVLSFYFFYLKFYITFKISFRSEKNRSKFMRNFIFCLSMSRHGLKSGLFPRAMAL